MAPPESIPNSEVKRSIADGSVGLPHVRVGQRRFLFFCLILKFETLRTPCKTRHSEFHEVK